MLRTSHVEPAPLPEPTEAEIQRTAYFLWLASGRIPGRDLENWHMAKELLRHKANPGPAAIRLRRRRKAATLLTVAHN